MDVDPFFRFMFVHASSWNDKSKGKEINLCVFFKVIIRNEATALPEIWDAHQAARQIESCVMLLGGLK